MSPERAFVPVLVRLPCLTLPPQQRRRTFVTVRSS